MPHIWLYMTHEFFSINSYRSFVLSLIVSYIFSEVYLKLHVHSTPEMDPAKQASAIWGVSIAAADLRSKHSSGHRIHCGHLCATCIQNLTMAQSFVA